MEEDCSASVVKRKRTKRRQRPPPPDSSATFSGSATEEEEDMANCLILLAQGPSFIDPAATYKPESGAGKFTSRRFAEAATTAGGKAGFFVYECKTCSKCFSSFQALGGHRASHKKPRLAIPSSHGKSPAIDEDSIQLSMSSFSSPAITAGKTRVHECSVCGAEFTSGQALGGHMRRHRPATMPESFSPASEGKKTGLSLDLNLPAPADDDFRAGGNLPTTSPAAFPFSGKPTLLLCHY